MPDLRPVLLWLSSAYLVAAAGGLSALVVRALIRRGGRTPAPAEATWCVFLPVVSLLLLPALAFQAHLAPPAWLHEWWHGWTRAVHRAPPAHAALHAANAALLLIGAYRLLRAVFTLWRMHAFATSLRSLAQPAPCPAGCGAEALPLYRVPLARPLCFTAGVVRPAVYVTPSLEQHLSTGEYAAMLAHEAAHLRRRDNAARTLLTFFYTLFPVPGACRLLDDWRRATERDCDAQAARQVGSPVEVAAALVRVAQLLRQHAAAGSAGPGVSAFVDGDDIEDRVEVLLSGSASPRRPLPVPLVGLSLGLLLASGCWLQHLVELFVLH